MKHSLLLLLALPAFAALPARAEGRLDHRGALGLLVAPGFEYASSSFAKGETAVEGLRPVLELGATFGLGSDGNEWVARLRLLKGSNDFGVGLGASYRAYFGREAWKTYFQLGLKADTTPHLTVGPAADFGVMFELSPLLGLFAQPGLSVELGSGLRFGAGALIGLQGRTYILE